MKKIIARVLFTPILVAAILFYSFLLMCDVEVDAFPLMVNFILSIPLKIFAAITVLLSTLTLGYLWSKDDEGPYLLFLKSRFREALNH